MTCLRIDQIYLYLEKEFSPSENKKIEEHLASCLKCKNALEERKILLQASESLTLWETPPDFIRQVMAQIFPEKVTARSWFITMAVGFSSIILMFLAFFLLSGQNLARLLINLSFSLLDLVRNISILFVKLFKLATLLVKIIVQFSRFLIEGFARLTTILSPEIQILLITLTLILSASLLYGMRRKFMTGEKA